MFSFRTSPSEIHKIVLHDKGARNVLSRIGRTADVHTVISPADSQGSGFLSFINDLHRSPLYINGISIEVLAMRRGLDIQAWEDPGADSEAFKRIILEILNEELSSRHSDELLSAYTQWLDNYVIDPVVNCFAGQEKAVWWINRVINLTVEDDVLRVKGEVEFAYVSNIATGETERLKASAAAEAFYQAGRGFVIDELSVFGPIERDVLLLARIYREEPLALLQSIPRKLMRSNLVSQVFESLPYPGFPFSACKPYNIWRPTIESETGTGRILLLEDFIGKKPELIAEIKTHIIELTSLPSVLAGYCPAEGGRGFRQYFTAVAYGNYPARAMRRLIDVLKEADIPQIREIIRQQAVLINLIKEGFNSCHFTPEFKTAFHKFIELLYRARNAAWWKQDIIDDLILTQQNLNKFVLTKEEQQEKKNYALLLHVMCEGVESAAIRQLSYLTNSLPVTKESLERGELLKQACLLVATPNFYHRNKPKIDIALGYIYTVFIICAYALLGAGIRTQNRRYNFADLVFASLAGAMYVPKICLMLKDRALFSALQREYETARPIVRRIASGAEGIELPFLSTLSPMPEIENLEGAWLEAMRVSSLREHESVTARGTGVIALPGPFTASAVASVAAIDPARQLDSV